MNFCFFKSACIMEVLGDPMSKGQLQPIEFLSREYNRMDRKVCCWSWWRTIRWKEAQALILYCVLPILVLHKVKINCDLPLSFFLQFQITLVVTVMMRQREKWVPKCLDYLNCETCSIYNCHSVALRCIYSILFC